jgi:7,8-dihydropterin-6-yl-methyl-4-(beta-D-ribofuranosyl)aminobenzene 5'-phosphate synthase
MLKKVKITILAENRVIDPNLLAEQGQSIFIETENGSVLFDVGQTDAFLHNAQHMKIDLNRIDKIILSHGHYDHTGGLPAFCNKIKPVDIICHPALINKKYRIYPEGRKDIGVPWDKKEVEHTGANFIFKTHAYEVIPDVWISGEIPRNTEYEKIDETYQQRVSESYIHDEIHDDMSLILVTERGLIVLLGCGHAGPINSIRHAMRITHTKSVHAVMGGMHLNNAPEDKIDQIVTNLYQINPDILIPLHCTGFHAINRMFIRFAERVKLMNVGDSYEL